MAKGKSESAREVRDHKTGLKVLKHKREKPGKTERLVEWMIRAFEAAEDQHLRG